MHDSTFDAVVVSEVCLTRVVLRLELLPLRLNLFQLSFVPYGFKEILNLSVLPLQLVLVIAPLLYDLLYLPATEEILFLVPEQFICHLLQDVLHFIRHSFFLLLFQLIY